MAEHHSRSSTRSSSQVAGHNFTSSLVQPINSFGKNVVPPGQRQRAARASCRRARSTASTGRSRARGSTPSTARPALVRFENHLDDDNGLDRQDFGAPELLVPDAPAQRPHGAGVRRPAALRATTASARSGAYTHEAACEPGRVGGPAVPRLPGRRRRPREAVVLLVPRPRPRPHRRQRLQGHGRPDADLRPEDRQRRRDRPERAARCPGRRTNNAGRLLRRRLRHPAGVLRLPRSTTASRRTRTRTTATARRTRSGGARRSSATSPTTASSATSSPSTARRTRCWRSSGASTACASSTPRSRASTTSSSCTRAAARRRRAPRLHRRRAAGPVPAARRPAVHEVRRRSPTRAACCPSRSSATLRAVAGQAPRVRRRLHQVHGRHADQEGRRDLPRQHR